ncbi:MAG: hypothetical protein LC792_21490, partial [Actinobacteria bacterium]|nr:hypothetical protein [Actinomycetota bacterium]
MDSTDAYAGTFLLATRMAYRVSGDRAHLARLGAGIAGAVKAVEATQQSDGLTWAKPSWKVKYLMDQAETYAGLNAGAELATALGNTTLSDRARSDARRMSSGVANLWNSGVGAYDWAVHEDGARVRTDWSLLYSDSLQQPWAVAFGLVEASRASTLMGRFSTGAMDSTDAYAGTFLLATRMAYRVSGDRAHLARLGAGIAGAV